MAAEDWARLGDYVVARRIALGMRDRRALAAATGVTDRTLGKLENGRRVSASTLGAVENHLDWGRGGHQPAAVRRPDAAAHRRDAGAAPGRGARADRACPQLA